VEREFSAAELVSNGRASVYGGMDGISNVQNSLHDLKNAISACKAEITGVCGKIAPGQGPIAACLLANKSTASKDCADAVQKIETTASQ
jgi:hypothetical protein